jgi:hypothetical protein
MKLDTDHAELMDRKILVCTDQIETTMGKTVVVSDDLRNRMIKPHNPEISVWKETCCGSRLSG